jgi:hypothetical protein
VEAASAVARAEKESDSTDDTLYSSGAEEPSTSSNRKASQLSRAFQAEELTYAAKVSLKAAGKRDESKVVHEAVFTIPTRATKIRKAWQTVQKSEVQIPLTSDEVVSLIVEAKLTKRQYMLIRKQAKEKHVDIYPSYHKVLEAKNRCYPPINCITITE